MEINTKIENCPLVSVIVPAYNHEHYIDDLLDSLVDQSYPRIELLVCDDRSTDNTFDKLKKREKELINTFEKVCICQNESNQGVVKTINRMLDMSRGKYVKVIASDDFFVHDGIERLVLFYEENQQYDIIFSNCVICDENTHYPVNVDCFRAGYSSVPDLSGNVFQKMFESNIILGSTVFALKNTYLKYGYYDENFAIEDWEYSLRMACYGKIGFFNEKTVAYRVVKTSQCHYTRDVNGRLRFRRMYKNIIGIHKKYQCSKIDLKRGYSKVYSLLLSTAIDSCDNKAIKNIYRVKKKFKLSFDREIQLKYITYRMHVLLPIQALKRKLGLEAGGVG